MDSSVHGRFIARILDIHDREITVCNYKQFNLLAEPHLLLPINNTYTKFDVHLNSITYDTNILYNILEVYLETYRSFIITLEDIIDTVLVLTINQLVGDEAVRHSCGMRNIYLIRYVYPDNNNTLLHDINEINIYHIGVIKRLRLESVIWYNILYSIKDIISDTIYKSCNTSYCTTSIMQIHPDHYNRLYHTCVKLTKILHPLENQHHDNNLNMINVTNTITNSTRTKRRKLCNGHQLCKVSEHSALQSFFVSCDVLDNLIGYDWRIGIPGRFKMNSIIPLLNNNIKIVDESVPIKFIYTINSSTLQFKIHSINNFHVNQEFVNHMKSRRKIMPPEYLDGSSIILY